MQKLAASAPSPSEKWACHPFHLNIYLSTEGRCLIWSGYKWRLADAAGYLRIGPRGIYIRDAANKITLHLGTLIAETFLGPRPPYHRIRYRNTHSRDLRVSNLRWMRDTHYSLLYKKDPPL